MKPGWTEVALGDVCEVTMGQAPPGDSYNSDGRGLPLVAGAGDFEGTGLAPTKYTTKPTRVSQMGDIVLSIRASIGARVRADGEYCLGRGVAGLRSKEHLDDHFLWHWIDQVTPILAAKGRGATFLQVNRKDIVELELPLPPLEEQQRIAAILDKADDLLAKRRAAVTHLDSLTQAIFLDMFGEPGARDSRWEIRPLGDVVTTTSGGTPDRSRSDYFGGSIPWVKSGELHTGVVLQTEEHLTEAGIANSAAKVMDAGTVLLAMYGATAGVVAELGVPAATNQAICAVTPGSSLDRIYLIHALRRLSGVLLRRVSGGAQPNLSQQTIRALGIPIPPIQLQSEFAAVIAEVSRTTTRVQASASSLSQATASLQSRAFRGEL